MEKNCQHKSELELKQQDKQGNYYYHHPSPTYPEKLTELDKLAYVASIFNSKKETGFNHAAEVSPFRPIGLRKK
ncbi:MAG: hypothetical protein RLY40_887 [Pseudomonadota bacterium]|jgi:hypothetical protein